MLTKLSVSNFKAFNDIQRARLAPITLIYGPNSSGKSSFVQSLLLAKQSLSADRRTVSCLDFTGPIVDLGDYGSVAFRHDVSRPISIEFSFRPDPDRETYRLPPKTAERQVSMFFRQFMSQSEQGERRETYAYPAGARYSLNDKTNGWPHFSLYFKNARQTARDQKLAYNRDKSNYFFQIHSPSDEIAEVAQYYEKYFGNELSRLDEEVNNKFRSFQLTKGSKLSALRAALSGSLVFSRDYLPTYLVQSKHSLDTAIGNHASKETLFTSYLSQRLGLRVDLIENFANEVRAELDSVGYLGPLRMRPTRLQVIHEREAASVGNLGEYASHVLTNVQDGAQQVNAWLRKLGIAYEIIIQQIAKREKDVGRVYYIRYKDTMRSTEVSAADIGVGVGQVLPILIEGGLFKSRIICVEQPELHLHPKLQAELADFFIETSLSNRADGIQWLLETHSELFLLRLLRRLKEKKIRANDVSVLFITPKGKDGGSTILPMEIDDHGRLLTTWPNGFFDEALNELQ